jgi:hypothetical protein
VNATPRNYAGSMSANSAMDIEWAKQQLNVFLQFTELRVPYNNGSIDTSGHFATAKPLWEIIPVAEVAEQIIDRVIPNWKSTVPVDARNQWMQQREAAQRALVRLERDEELREKLGDSAPQLNAGELHPWVWEAARSLWQSQHYGEAVRAAAIKINAETQNKVGRREVSEVTLFNQSFSTDDPKTGQPRLRLMENDGSKTFSSRQRGAMALAEACFAGLRNLGSHDPQDELPEHEALEQLATFSVLARFVDRAALVHA